MILRKLSAAGQGNALSRALRALGRVKRVLFTLRWLSDLALHQRSHAGLNKGEASNALRRAIFFHRQSEIRDRTFENQSFRASGLSVLTAAIVHWNTVYLHRAVQHLCGQGITVLDELLVHVASLGWEHIAPPATTSGPTPIQPSASGNPATFASRSSLGPRSVQFRANRAAIPPRTRRLIPARAGNTPAASHHRSDRSAHPRACGEHISSRRNSTRLAG